MSSQLKALVQKLLLSNGIALARVKPIRVSLRRATDATVNFPDEIVNTIAEFYERVPPFYTDDTPKPLRIAGAWRGDLHERRKSQLSAIASGDWNRYKDLLNNLFRSELVSGMWNYGYFASNDVLIPQGMLKDVTYFELETGRDANDLVRTQKFSSDWGLQITGGGIVKYVDPYHGRQAHRILLAHDYLKAIGNCGSGDVSPDVIVDLGSGFGGTASYLLNWARAPIHLLLVDIPLNLTTAYAYLAAGFPDLSVQLISSLEQLHRYDIQKDRSSVVLVPTIFLEEAVKYIQPCVLHNSASFSEMDLATVQYYLDVFTKGGTRIVIETNSGLKGSQNQGGHVEVTTFDIERLLPKDYWLLSRAKVEDVRYVTSTYLRI